MAGSPVHVAPERHEQRSAAAELDRFVHESERFVEVTALDGNLGLEVVRVGEAVVELDGAPGLLERILVAPGEEERPADVHAGVDGERIELFGAAVLSQRAIEVALNDQQISVLAVNVGVIGVEQDGPLELPLAAREVELVPRLTSASDAWASA